MNKFATALTFVLLAILLSSCGENSSTGVPSSTPTAPLPTNSAPAVTNGVITPDPEAISLPPAQTLALLTPVPLGTPTPTPIFGVLPTPPRGISPASVASPDSSGRFPPNTFVVSTRTGLFLLPYEGNGEQVLSAGAGFSDPEVSPDGSRVAAFRTDPVNLQKQLYLISPTGTLKAVTESGGVILSAHWSPDSKTLALTRVTDDNNDGVANENDSPYIWLYEVATDKQRKLTEGRNPVWSPDGVRLVYVVPGPYNDEIDPSTRKPRLSPNTLTVYNLQSNQKRALLDTRKLEVLLPSEMEEGLKGQTVTVRYFKETSWNPDGKRIVASADAVTRTGVFTGLVLSVTLEDVNPKIVSAGGDAAGWLVWSADGRRLAFEVAPQYPVKPSSAYRIALAEGVDSTAKSPQHYLGSVLMRSESRNPRWINRGLQLAFVEGDNGILAVYTETAQVRRLVSGCTGFAWVGG
jgi:Tol biopolymer transport system component